MGQKVNPHGLRVGIIKDWDSKWYANKKDFPALLKEDYDIRKYIKTKYFTSGISRIYVDRTANNRVFINIFTAKPGMIVGKGGENIKMIREDLEKMTKKKIHIDISEIRNPDIDAQLVAENVAFSLERRISFRRAMKQAIQRSMRSGAKGIKMSTAGRLGGADMARTESYSEGNVPLSTLRADISYGFAEADTTFGKLGIKVWINNGEVLSKPNEGRLLTRLTPGKAADKKFANNRKPRRNFKK